MSRSKLEKFAENLTFPNYFQFENNFFSEKPYFPLKGKWNTFFKNDNPIVLELACGRGEYTIGLAETDSDKNFIGVDRKGARIWKGCKYSVVNNMNNVAFLRTQIQFLPFFFEEGEIREIWITFPDPQVRGCKENKRLTSDYYLSIYRRVMSKDACVHLKTDSDFFYDYTIDVVNKQNLPVMCEKRDIYKDGIPDKRLNIQTYYEKMWLEKGASIHYLLFKINQ